MTQAFKVLRTDRAADKSLTVGQTIYDCRGYDYGTASDDTRFTGIKHVSMSLDPTGDYPFFTIPEADIERIETPENRDKADSS